MISTVKKFSLFLSCSWRDIQNPLICVWTMLLVSVHSSTHIVLQKWRSSTNLAKRWKKHWKKFLIHRRKVPSWNPLNRSSCIIESTCLISSVLNIRVVITDLFLQTSALGKWWSLLTTKWKLNWVSEQEKIKESGMGREEFPFMVSL